MKRCPVCKAGAFDDALVCYGCLFRFEVPEEGVAQCASEESLAASKESTVPLPPLTGVCVGSDQRRTTGTQGALHEEGEREANTAAETTGTHGTLHEEGKREANTAAATTGGAANDAAERADASETVAEGVHTSEVSANKEASRKNLIKTSAERKELIDAHGSLPAAVLSGLAAGGFEDLPSEAWGAPPLLVTVEVPGFLLAKGRQFSASRPMSLSVTEAPRPEAKRSRGAFPRSCAYLRQGYEPQGASSTGRGRRGDAPDAGGAAAEMPWGRQDLEMLLPTAFSSLQRSDELLESR